MASWASPSEAIERGRAVFSKVRTYRIKPHAFGSRVFFRHLQTKKPPPAVNFPKMRTENSRSGCVWQKWSGSRFKVLTPFPEWSGWGFNGMEVGVKHGGGHFTPWSPAPLAASFMTPEKSRQNFWKWSWNFTSRFYQFSKKVKKAQGKWSFIRKVAVKFHAPILRIFIFGRRIGIFGT